MKTLKREDHTKRANLVLIIMIQYLEEKQIDSFKADGYLLVPGVLSGMECEVILKQAETYAEKDGSFEYREIINPDRVMPDFWRLMRHPFLTGALETLLDGEVCGLQSVFVFKKPGTLSGEHAWHPHQDNSYIKARGDTYLAGDFLIEDHDPGNGGMYFYPGSHREPILPYEENKSFGQEKGKNPGNRVLEIPEKYHKADIYAEKGSLLVIHGRVIHGSYANSSSTRGRAVLLMAFIKKGADFYKGKDGARKEISLKGDI